MHSAATVSSWAYTDSVSPFKTFLNGPGDAPVGAWRDPIDKLHFSKSYFTFTLPPLLRTARIFAAEVNALDRGGIDCTKPRATELWLTDTTERPTWQYQPRERHKLPGPGGSTECTGFVGWSAGDAVRQALAAGQSKITLAMRMPGDKQRDPAYGRNYANNPDLLITYNLAPEVPSELTFTNKPCAADQFMPGSFQPTMAAVVRDPDNGENIAAQFALWPVDSPLQRFERTSSFGGNESRVSVGLPEGLLEDSRVYEWTARAFDGDDFSAFAPSCRFTTDFTPPDTEPTVSGVDGGPGNPWRFTFTANGVPDVVGFQYSSFDSGGTFVAADQLGGGATIGFTPPRSGFNTLFVRSTDRAGNVSPARLFDFFVTPTEPSVTRLDPSPGYGMPTELRVGPRMADVVSYTWTMNGGPETTAAAEQGGATVISVVPSNLFTNRLDIWSTTTTGQRSAAAHVQIFTTDEPRVHSDDYPDSAEHGRSQGSTNYFFEVDP